MATLRPEPPEPPPLSVTHPQLAAEWHPTNNGDLSPSDLMQGSGKAVFWRCRINPNHEWKAKVYSRAQGNGCPYCAGRIGSHETSLRALHPDLADQWHPTKNGALSPDQVVPGSARKVWWRCPQDPTHEWKAKVLSRVRSGSDCPLCGSLQGQHPQLAAQWHPTKNGDRRPEDVAPGSNRKVWWRCPDDPSHEWQAVIAGRVKGNGCPMCSGRIATPETCLRAQHPELAAEWHPDHNGTLTPDDVTPGSGKRIWWRCRRHPSHEWEAVIGSRVNGFGCPICAGRLATPATSLRAIHPELATEWHPTNNGALTPDDVVPGSEKNVWWRCRIDSSHEWQAKVLSRTQNGSGCTKCKSLRVLHPELAAEWHPTKNGELTPDDVTPGSSKKVWWRCRVDPGHEWEATVSNRAGGVGCPTCSGRVATPTTSLRALHPDLADQWHPTRNGDLTPDDVVPGSARKVWWRCPDDPVHEWETVILRRVNGVGCPTCSGRVATPTTSLRALHPDLADQWHPTRNGDLTPDDVVPGSAKKAWWCCPHNSAHQWEAVIYSRTRGGNGCPACNKGWTIEAIRGFVASLQRHLDAFEPAELYLLFQQNGLLGSSGRGRSFVKALATGRFPTEEIKKFVNNEPSLVDQFIGNPNQVLSDLGAKGAHIIDPDRIVGAGDSLAGDEFADRADALVEGEGDPSLLPVVETKRVLASLEHAIVSTADTEAVEYLIASAVAKIWKHAFNHETMAIAQAEAFHGSDYAERVQTRFLDEYHQAKGLLIPEGYAFAVEGRLATPNLMQRLVAVRVRDHKRIGNWSGTGAGKTLSAVLASRTIASRLTVICCPNSVVVGWKRMIHEIFPDSVVATKTLHPRWSALGGGAAESHSAASSDGYRYLVLNYESLQQENSLEQVRALVEREPIDFIIIDEIHYTKQRAVENMSRRRQVAAALVAGAAERNPDLHVLGMSATPVINNLQEGKSLVELITGVAHDEIETRPTLSNCMKLHQRLVTLGIRWMPEYDLGYEQIEIPVDCAEFLDEIRGLGRRNGNPLALEQILTRARLPVIRAQIRPKTLVYTHNVEGIDRMLWEAIKADGWKVGFFTGDEKSGLDGFLEGDVDVLIGSGAIVAGVDGLQRVCNRLIVAVLPWTAADFEQLKGRIYRQGQQDPVTMVLPLTYAQVHGARWSWCESKMQRLRFKKSIADAAVDGVVPEGHLRTPAQAYQDVMAWLDRLDSGQVEVITRPKIAVPALSDDPSDVARRRRRYGDFSRMNRTWNQRRSEVTHERLRANPEEWMQYHTLFREARQGWAVLPCQEMIRWCRQREGYVIGDFGCGEAELARALSDRHTVHSFDHIAINADVIACNMAHVPLEDGVLDLAIFSLALMGSNFTDYLREAHRTLKLDGELHIVEATSRFTDRNQFTKALRGLGFVVVETDDWWKFTHIRALKAARPPHQEVELRF
jgi:Hypothetical methyltransferase/Probable Zinc-ribbon domain/Type III restriction enzyme, res subunit